MNPLRKDSSRPAVERSEKDADDGWERRERLNKSEAERLLDWLEANGYSKREVSYAEDSGFTVRWRR
jgi:hypothetical protein